MTFDRNHVVAELRRDAALLWSAAIATVFVGFALLAVGAAIVDLMALRH